MKNINKLYAEYKKNRGKIKFNEFEKTKGVNTKRKIAVIVPYRDNALKERSKQLAEFVKHMTKFLKGYDYKIFVIEQDEGRKFNRGALLNIGLKMAVDEGYTILVTHDVDLLPCDDMLGYYTTYSKYPIHQGWRWKDKYTFDDFLGGILTLTPKQVRMTNGYPNNFWGGYIGSSIYFPTNWLINTRLDMFASESKANLAAGTRQKLSPVHFSLSVDKVLGDFNAMSFGLGAGAIFENVNDGNMYLLTLDN